MFHFGNRKVFGVPVEGTGFLDVLTKVKEATPGHPIWVVTMNPEILLAARRDRSYADVLKQADIRLVDGFGLWALLGIFGIRTKRVPGVEFAERILEEANVRGWRVAFLGGESGEEKGAEKNVQKKFPQLSIMSEAGGRVDREGQGDVASDEANQRLTMFDPQVLFVAYGHPKQEKWIVQHAHDFPNLKIIVGVGGTFNFWAGRLSRAPKWLRTIGLEWVWRLMLEPKRWKRILDAVVIFPFWFLIDRSTNHS